MRLVINIQFFVKISTLLKRLFFLSCLYIIEKTIILKYSALHLFQHEILVIDLISHFPMKYKFP